MSKYDFELMSKEHPVPSLKVTIPDGIFFHHSANSDKDIEQLMIEVEHIMKYETKIFGRSVLEIPFELDGSKPILQRVKFIEEVLGQDRDFMMGTLSDQWFHKIPMEKLMLPLKYQLMDIELKVNKLINNIFVENPVLP